MDPNYFDGSNLHLSHGIIKCLRVALAQHWKHLADAGTTMTTYDNEPMTFSNLEFT